MHLPSHKHSVLLLFYCVVMTAWVYIRLYCRSGYFLFSLITCNHTNETCKGILCTITIDLFVFKALTMKIINNMKISSQKFENFLTYCSIYMCRCGMIVHHYVTDSTLCNYLFFICTCMLCWFVHYDMFPFFIYIGWLYSSTRQCC